MGQVRNTRVGHSKISGSGVEVIKGDGSLRKMRCPRCKKLAMPRKNNAGKLVCVCACGAEITSTRM